MGFETADDASVYRLTDDIAMINTVDFITPPVDDPYWFGQISAANSISDVYSMGGKPLTALNVVMFPAKHLDMAGLGPEYNSIETLEFYGGVSFLKGGIVFADALPKTRSGKIMRRVLKARVLGQEEGDLTTLEE